VIRAVPLRRTAIRRRATVRTRIARRELDDSRQIVIARSGGRCERCGQPGAQAHHRRPRMMGGSTAVGMNAPPNLAWLCLVCHLLIETDRDAAREAGWLLARLAHADRTAVRLWTGRWVRLTDAGTYLDVTERGGGA
jgi:5-methylcytosine-specific restriction enzyme A